MLSRIAGLKVLWTTSLLLMLFVLVLGLNLCVAQSNGDIRVQFSPSSYEFISNESIDIQIVVQEYKSGRWSNTALKSYDFNEDDLSVNNGTLGTLRYGDDAFRDSIKHHPTFIQDWYVNNYAKHAQIRFKSPSSGSGNIDLNVRANAFRKRGNQLQTSAFTANYSYIAKDLEVQNNTISFSNDHAAARVILHIRDRSNNQDYRVDNFDISDLNFTILDNSNNPTDDRYTVPGPFVYVPYSERIFRGLLRVYRPKYEFFLPPPRNLNGGLTSGKIKISLKPGAMSGLADDDIDITYTFNYSNPIVAKVDFVVLHPKPYYRNGTGANPDPEFLDLDGESVILGLYWDRHVTGIETSDFEVEIDNTDDNTDNYVTSTASLIQVPRYPEGFPLDPVPFDEEGDPDPTMPLMSCEFKLLIPASGSGRLRVYLKENACDQGNVKTLLKVFSLLEPAAESFISYGP